MEEPKSARTHPGGLYVSYMLRMWSASAEGDRTIWRASVESPITHEQSQFQDLESLFAFLLRMTEYVDVGDSD